MFTPKSTTTNFTFTIRMFNRTSFGYFFGIFSFCSLVNGFFFYDFWGNSTFEWRCWIHGSPFACKPELTLISNSSDESTLALLNILKSCDFPLPKPIAQINPVKRHTINKTFMVCNFFFRCNSLLDFVEVFHWLVGLHLWQLYDLE